jgi:drug/metabolite transporter (DMT)-like permease
MDATMKALAGRYPPFQVATLRGLVSLPFVIGWVYWRERKLTTLIRVRWRWHLARGVLAVVMLTTFIYAIRGMPLSEAYTLFFVSPLLITAMSVPLLKESVDARRWLAILAGFGGVLIVLRPGLVTVRLTTVAILISATCYALNAITVRVLGRSDSTGAMSFWFIVTVAIGAGLIALPDWRPILPAHAGLLVALGVTGSLGQVFVTEAFRSAPVSVVAPFEYSSLFWGLGMDLVFWGRLPEPIVFAGAAVIAGSGLYLIHRERKPPLIAPP